MQPDTRISTRQLETRSKSMVCEEVRAKSVKDGTIKWRIVEFMIEDDTRLIIEAEQREPNKKVGMNKCEYSTL